MDWLGLLGAVGGAAGIISAFVSWLEWRKTQRKIAMLSDASKAAEILPAWYTERMMTDYWLFGLLTVSGDMIGIVRINALSDDGKWMDVTLAQMSELSKLTKTYGRLIGAIADDRTDASIQIDKIVGALELQTS